MHENTHLWANTGRYVSGGTWKGTCKVFDYSNQGYEFFGMKGRSGNELDAVSFYLRKR